MKRIREINVIEESPLKSKSINQYIENIQAFNDLEKYENSSTHLTTELHGLNFSKQMIESSAGAIFSPTFEPKLGESSPDEIILNENSHKNDNQELNFSVMTASLEQLKARSAELEQMISEKQAMYNKEYKDTFPENDILRKTLEKKHFESEVNFIDLIKHNSKKIYDYLKKIDNCKIELFNSKAREYKLELELAFEELEIENIIKDINQIEVEKNKMTDDYEKSINNLKEANDQHLEENKFLKLSNEELLKDALDLMMME